MKENSFVIIYGDEPEDLIKKIDATFPGHRTSLLQLGAPDEALVYRNLFELMQIKDNYKFFNNMKVVVDNERLPTWKPIVQRVQDDLGRAFGSYSDTLMGIENMFKNLPYIIKYPDTSDMKINCDVAIMLMAGPSFELEIERIKEVQDKYFIVACDAILKRCQEEGIKPDMVVTSERIALTSDFFRTMEDTDTLLMANAVCWPDTFNIYKGPIATFWRASTESHWIRRKTKNKEELVWAPAVVSSVSLGILGVLGVKKVILVGQDLCHHPETGQSHADLRIDAFKEWSEPKLDLKPLSYKAPMNEGDKEVWTNARWHAFGTELYRIAAVYKQDLINTSKLGIKIPGINYMPLDKALKKWPSDSKEFICPEKNPFDKQDLNRIKSKVNKAIKEMSKLKIGSLGSNSIGYFRNYFNFGYLGLSLMLNAFAKYESEKYRRPWKEASYRPDLEVWLTKTKMDLIRVLSNARDLLNNLRID